MPVMDGIEATKIIIGTAELRGSKRIPILGVSSSNNDDDRQNFIAAGICEFVQKPVSKDQLGALLMKYITD